MVHTTIGGDGPLAIILWLLCLAAVIDHDPIAGRADGDGCIGLQRATVSPAFGEMSTPTPRMDQPRVDKGTLT